MDLCQTLFQKSGKQYVCICNVCEDVCVRNRSKEIIASSWKYKWKTALKTHAMLLWMSLETVFSYRWQYNFTSKTMSVHAVTFSKWKSVHETGTSYSSRKLILSIYLAPLLEIFACATVLIFSEDMCFHFNNIPLFLILLACGQKHWANEPIKATTSFSLPLNRGIACWE